jgi:adenine-specific DNA-methyltransferase
MRETHLSKLTALLDQLKAKDPILGSDLDREFKALSSRLSFGLIFERHSPEAVELPLRPIRRGDKVRVSPARGSNTGQRDLRLWIVKKIHKDTKQATLNLANTDTPEEKLASLDDLIVVAEFRDTIYPGFVSTGKVSRGGDKAWHTVINGENYHALKALTFTHRGKVDAIYIDPPYNTGAKDWKYNNDYVEADDLYRHSKWLAMMERRLLVAKELLNPSNSVLIITIDEKEYLRLGLLLEQIFLEAKISMVSSVINPAGAGREADFSRTDEYVFFVRFGDSKVAPESRMQGETDVVWDTLRRSSLAGARGNRGPGACGPNQFFPIYVDPLTGKISSIGEPLDENTPVENAPSKPGLVTVLPIRPNGTEMNWGITPSVAERLLRNGYLRAGRPKPLEPQRYVISYLTSGIVQDITNGIAVVRGRNTDGTIDAFYPSGRDRMPTTNWNRPSHDAQQYGTKTVNALLDNRPFPYPKSLYAVEDALRFFIGGNKTATVLDFFSGSGTTAHAVMRLNKQDGGNRLCISVTNNEVAVREQESLRDSGFRPGSDEWEKMGICEYITKPRIAAAITGKTPNGDPIQGEYKFTDEFPMSEGFEENAEFFTLTYETPISVSHNRAFERISPLLWMRAGSSGTRIDKLPTAGWAVAETYGILIQLDHARHFLKAVAKVVALRVVYIVTDDERRFQALAQRLPCGVETVRLYESYLTNFAFVNGSDK